MLIEGKALPMLPPDEPELDIWPLAKGMAITISDTTGNILAGCWLTSEQWQRVLDTMSKGK